LRIFSLGSFGLAISGNGLDVDSWKRKKALLVLKCLISQLDKPVHRERLIDWIWPESDPAKSWPRLKVTISYLRRALRDGGASANVLETVGQSYILRRSSVWIDSEVFCKRVSAGWEFLTQDKLKEAQVQFEEAESLYRGDFIEDEPYAEWCTVERERLREIYLELLAGLVKCYTEAGEHMMASRVCRLALSSDPCRENFIRALMECLVSMNRTDWARAHFISWRRTLDQEYELQPTEETLEVFSRIVGEDTTQYRSTA
jgi:DNA-binding SARP family transcriptional activator